MTNRPFEGATGRTSLLNTVTRGLGEGSAGRCRTMSVPGLEMSNEKGTTHVPLPNFTTCRPDAMLNGTTISLTPMSRAMTVPSRLTSTVTPRRPLELRRAESVKSTETVVVSAFGVQSLAG
jgi:hypothetical protein